jgi:gag-polypeptide of LTR copia-type
LTGQLKEPDPLAPEATNQQKKDHEASVKLFKRANGYAVTLISTTVDDEPMQLIIMFKKAKEMWDKLIASYEQKSEQRLEHLYLDLLEYKKDPCDSIATHISKLQKLWLELNEESVRVDECQLPKTLLIVRIPSTLPGEYFEFRTTWESVPRSQRTIDYLLERLVMVEMRVSKRQSETTVSSSSALVAKGHWQQSYHTVEDKKKGSTTIKKFERPKKDYSKIKCHVCHVCGHTKYRCPKNCAAETVNQVSMVKHHNDNDDSAGLIVNHVALSASNSCLLNNSWIVDSGATCHMCNRSELFIEFAPLKQTLRIALGDGHKVKATAQGVVAVMVCPKGANYMMFYMFLICPTIFSAYQSVLNMAWLPSLVSSAVKFSIAKEN